jgi:hypothetical protein
MPGVRLGKAGVRLGVLEPEILGMIISFFGKLYIFVLHINLQTGVEKEELLSRAEVSPSVASVVVSAVVFFIFRPRLAPWTRFSSQTFLMAFDLAFVLSFGVIRAFGIVIVTLFVVKITFSRRKFSSNSKFGKGRRGRSRLNTIGDDSALYIGNI